MKLVILVAVFLTVQIVLIAVCLSPLGARLLRGRRLGTVVTIVLIEALAAVSLVLGAYSERRWEPLSTLQAYLSASGDETSRALGTGTNPSLLDLLSRQAPAIPRPSTNDAIDFISWQEVLRTHLRHEVFRIENISMREDVPVSVSETTTLATGVTRQLIRFTAFDGTEIPAYLFVPDEAERRPGILVIPGHVRETESGIAQTAGLTPSYQHAAALRLAEAGFVTLTPELRGFGLLGRPYTTEHVLVAYNAILAGTFYKAIITRDLKRAVDVLQSRPEVDPDRIGISGASYGGEMSVAYAALDPRIKTIVFQAYGGALGVTPGVAGTKADQPHYCHIIPGANMTLHREDMFLLLAPRPTLGIRGDQEGFGDPAFEPTLREGWQALGRPDALELAVPAGGHEYFVEPAIAFFAEHL